jgi:hypothetical protein
MLLQDFENIDALSEEDKAAFRREYTHSEPSQARVGLTPRLILFEEWHQPWTLYSVVACCSMAAAVQGVRASSL